MVFLSCLRQMPYTPHAVRWLLACVYNYDWGLEASRRCRYSIFNVLFVKSTLTILIIYQIQANCKLFFQKVAKSFEKVAGSQLVFFSSIIYTFSDFCLFLFHWNILKLSENSKTFPVLHFSYIINATCLSYEYMHIYYTLAC